MSRGSALPIQKGNSPTRRQRISEDFIEERRPAENAGQQGSRAADGFMRSNKKAKLSEGKTFNINVSQNWSNSAWLLLVNQMSTRGIYEDSHMNFS